MNTLHLVLFLCLVAVRVHGQDGDVARAEQQRKGVDLLTATVVRDGKGNPMYVEFKPADLRERHLHLLCEVVTTQSGLALNGMTPPKGMLTKGEQGWIYRGELQSFKGDEIEIRMRYPGQPNNYKTAFIPKKDVVYLTFPLK